MPLLLLALVVGPGCGTDDDAGLGSDDDSSSSPATNPGAGEDSGEDPNADPADVSACDLLPVEEVAAAVGLPVQGGAASGGPTVTGGTYTSCTWQSDDPARPGGRATLYLYPNTAAADSARTDRSQDLAGLGDAAFTVSFAGIWVYLGERSFMTQWYDLEGSDQEHLPVSEALARLVVDKLS